MPRPLALIELEIYYQTNTSTGAVRRLFLPEKPRRCLSLPAKIQSILTYRFLKKIVISATLTPNFDIVVRLVSVLSSTIHIQSSMLT